MKTINRLENGRAAYAYWCAEKGKELGEKKAKEYKSYVKKIPMLIKTNGLGATMAFVFSKSKKRNSNKGDEAYKKIYEQIIKWFQEEANPYYLWFKDRDFQQEEFVEIICKMNSQQYRAITKETLALFTWIRRFADGLIEGEE